MFVVCVFRRGHVWVSERMLALGVAPWCHPWFLLKIALKGTCSSPLRLDWLTSKPQRLTWLCVPNPGLTHLAFGCLRHDLGLCASTLPTELSPSPDFKFKVALGRTAWLFTEVPEDECDSVDRTLREMDLCTKYEEEFPVRWSKTGCSVSRHCGGKLNWLALGREQKKVLL